MCVGGGGGGDYVCGRFALCHPCNDAPAGIEITPKQMSMVTNVATSKVETRA